MNPADIHGKRLIAVAGLDVFGKAFIGVVNKEIASFGLMAIGININEEDFGFFISNLPDSKVEITIFMPEFQEKAARHFGADGYLIATLKDGDKLWMLTDENPRQIDDMELLRVINELRMEYGV